MKYLKYFESGGIDMKVTPHWLKNLDEIKSILNIAKDEEIVVKSRPPLNDAAIQRSLSNFGGDKFKLYLHFSNCLMVSNKSNGLNIRVGQELDSPAGVNMKDIDFIHAVTDQTFMQIIEDTYKRLEEFATSIELQISYVHGNEYYYNAQVITLEDFLNRTWKGTQGRKETLIKVNIIIT
jgi:hypothetical protein